MQTKLKQLKAIFLEAAENEEERFNVEQLWPYQDTVDQSSVAQGPKTQEREKFVVGD